ncbi:MAG: nickel-dependent lactate racemase [Bacillota bacterium]
MVTKLPYGGQDLDFQIPDNKVIKVLLAKPLPELLPEAALVQEALANPIDSAPLGDIVRSGESACIIVGDTTRLFARHEIIVPPILNELNRGGIPDANILIVSAAGDHRIQTAEEHCRLVGNEAFNRVQVIDHRARDHKNMTFLGTTAYGTPVRINKKVLEANRIILTGSIVYHFLAGWGGGKKAVLPGVAGYETITKNHSLAFHPEQGKGLNPAVCAARTSGNPCSEDMLQGAEFVKPDFLVNTIINDVTHKIAYVLAGNYITAHEKGCRLVNDHYGISIAGKAELVIASCGGYPKDINFYQTYKTIYNAHFALKKGGTLLLLSESREGFGNDDFESILKDYCDNRARENSLRQKYTIGGHMGYHTSLLAEENNIIILTDLPAEEVRQIGITAVDSLDEGIRLIKGKHGDIPPAYIMPFGGSTLPFVTA